MLKVATLFLHLKNGLAFRTRPSSAHRCVSTVRAPRDDSIRSPHLTAPGAALGFLGSPGRYQISPVRPLLYQPRCPPAKQMTAPAATAPSVTNDTSARLLSISYRCQGRGCHANALTSAAGREHGRAGRLCSFLAVSCCYFHSDESTGWSGILREYRLDANASAQFHMLYLI